MLDHLLTELRHNGEVTFSVRVRPNASKTKLIGALDDGSLKIDIAAVPEDGKANMELIAFLAETFDVQRRDVSIIGGIATRRKIVRIVL